MNQLTCMHCGETYPDFDVAHVCSKGPYALKIKSMSNNIIKELEKQCWSHRVDGALVDGQLHFDTTKFAELIVQECMRQVEEQYKPVLEDGAMMNEAHWKGYLHCGVDSVVAIREHFGVEE